MLSDYGKMMLNWGTGVIAIAMLTEILRPRNQAGKLIEAMGKSHSLMIKTAMGEIPVRLKTDVLGNVHAPDDNGYCECWSCPKWDGIEWWTPKEWQ